MSNNRNRKVIAPPTRKSVDNSEQKKAVGSGLQAVRAKDPGNDFSSDGKSKSLIALGPCSMLLNTNHERDSRTALLESSVGFAKCVEDFVTNHPKLPRSLFRFAPEADRVDYFDSKCSSYIDYTHHLSINSDNAPVGLWFQQFSSMIRSNKKTQSKDKQTKSSMAQHKDDNIDHDSSLVNMVLCGRACFQDGVASIPLRSSLPANSHASTIARPVFHPFISSTFTDTAIERDLLILLLYPFLAEYARDVGIVFMQPSEMRWGIGKSLEKRHMTRDVCVSEIKRCQQSQGLNYILLLGNKYGSRFPRTTIPIEDYELLRKAVVNSKRSEDVQVLDTWYQRDNNHNVYVLRYLSTEDLTRTYWSEAANKLYSILSTAAVQVFTTNETKRALYAVSITHEEAYHGIDSIHGNDLAHKTAVIIRNFKNLDQIASDQLAAKDTKGASALRSWIDISNDGQQQVDTLAPYLLYLLMRMGMV
jgi:hypothetical protein